MPERRFPPPWSVEEGETYFVVKDRFPPPWSAEEVTTNCFVGTDVNGQKLAYIYYENEPGRRSAAKLLSKDEARRNYGEYREAAVSWRANHLN
jgi:hypothetical protein